MTINTKCSTHGREQCMECSLSVSAAEHEKLKFCPNITLSPFDQIGKVDWQCQHHGSTRFMWACVECVKEQLAAEYERGKKEAVANFETEVIKDLREMLDKAHERVSTYYREKCDLEKQLAKERELSKNNLQNQCDLEKDYATLKQHHENARKQIEVASRIVNYLKRNTPYGPGLEIALKEWEAL